MTVKCIAIGNRLMSDDGISIKVAEKLSPRLKQLPVELIYGETDIDYALGKIQDGDFLFIVDSTYLEIEPGSVTFTPISEASGQYTQVYSQHQPSLIHLLKLYGKSVEGYIVGIEAKEIDFSIELSDVLQERLPNICDEVYKFIKSTVRRINMHDTYLLNKVSKSLEGLCKENNVKMIDKFTIVVNNNSHINEEGLREHLKLHNRDIVADELQINIQRDDIEDQCAIIENIEGETFEI